jgi:hypothetical protein
MSATEVDASVLGEEVSTGPNEDEDDDDGGGGDDDIIPHAILPC